MKEKGIMKSVDEYNGKTVLEVLPKLKYKNVKIGTNGGSGFFYCGDSKAFKGVTGERFIRTINKSMRKKFRMLLHKAQKDFETHLRCYPNPEKYIKNQILHNIDYSFDGYLEALSEWFKKAKNRQNKIYKYEKILKDRQHLFYRKVVEGSLSTDEEDCIILIIDGVEEGDFWSINEYENAGDVYGDDYEPDDDEDDEEESKGEA